MPIDRTKYPPNWEAFSRQIRYERAFHRCECSGECGLHQGRRCCEVNHQPARWAKGRVILTTAHLCDCYPICANAEHVKAMCQRCHLRVDRYRHAAGRLATQRSTRVQPRLPTKASYGLSGGILPELPQTPRRKRNRLWFPGN